MVHPVYSQVRAALAEAQSQGLTPAQAAEWLSRAAHGERPAEATPAGDALARLAWLLFVRAPSLDGRYVALAPMQLGWLSSGQRNPAEVVDELAKLEQVQSEGSTEALDGLLTVHGDALLATVLEQIQRADRTSDVLSAAMAAADAGADAAIAAGRWDKVPLEGPDAEAVRTALRLRGPKLGGQVFAAWRRAAACAESEDLPGAVAAANEAVKATPDLFEAWVRRARYSFANGDRVGAGADLERALSLNNQSAMAHAMRAELRMTIRDLEGSLQDWQAAVKVAPSFAAFHMGLGYTWLAAGKLESAIASLEQAAALEPDDPSFLLSLADVHVRRRDLAAAIHTYDRLLARHPDEAQALLNRGTARLMLRHSDGAWADLTRVVELRPLEAAPWARRGAAALQQGRAWQGWLDALTALAVAPTDWGQEEATRQLLQQAYLGLVGGQPDPADLSARFELLGRIGAGSHVLRLAELLGDHLPAEGLAWHLLRGHAFLDHGRWPEAERAADDAIAVDGQSAAAWLLLGRARLGQGRFADALDALDAAAPRAWDLDASDTFELHLSRARCLGALQRLPDAIAAFGDALALRPERADVWFYLGVHLDLAGRREESVDAYSRSIEHNPAFAAAWYNRACEHAVLGSVELALADLRHAVALEPKLGADARSDTYLASLGAALEAL